jgi:SAM-dependent methyltransferase
MDEQQLAAVREGSRAMWAAGHYPTVAERLWPVAEALVAQAGVTVGDRVLDVGTGSGSVAVAAAARGATVTGIDHVDTWFPFAYAAADAAGVSVDLELADAEDLPYPDAVYDVVVSNFAHIFAPRHDVVAAEMARVCRPGGTVAFTVWAELEPGGRPDAFAIIREALGDDGHANATARDWGAPGYAAERFAAHGVELALQRHTLRWEFPSEDAHARFLLTASGPLIKAREALEAMGRWDEVWARVRESSSHANLATDGTYVMEQHYLLAVGTRAA